MNIHLLIVEDEQLIRNQLSKIPWTEIGITSTCFACNAAEAWKLAQSHHPDILIADIRMPGESGLELSKRLISRLPALKIILLTAYDEFEYAQSAIQIGAFEYLLKPLEKESIMAAVHSAIETIGKERQALCNTNIANLLKENNYNVVGINLNNYKSDKFHVYESLKDIPHNVDIVAIIKESIHNYCIIDEMELLDIKNIYFEKGSYTEYILKKAKEAKLNIVNFVDLYEELKLK